MSAKRGDYIKKTNINKAKLKILNLLKAKQIVSGEQLSESLKISRTAVWKNIKGLMELGYEISSRKGEGYQLEKIPEMLYPWELHWNTNLDLEVYHFNELASTNKYAKEIPAGSLVITEHQTTGRGRMGRSWQSDHGGIYFSLTVSPCLELEEISALPLVVSVAICQVIRRDFNLDGEIKWPNDVLIDGRKVAGVLLELIGETDLMNQAIIGVGINVNQEHKGFSLELKDKVTTLSYELNSKVDRRQLLVSIVEEILTVLDTFYNNPEEVLNNWRKLSCTLGQNITVNKRSRVIEGIAEDIDSHGALVIQSSSVDRTKIFSGDIISSSYQGGS